MGDLYGSNGGKAITLENCGNNKLLTPSDGVWGGGWVLSSYLHQIGSSVECWFDPDRNGGRIGTAPECVRLRMPGFAGIRFVGRQLVGGAGSACIQQQLHLATRLFQLELLLNADDRPHHIGDQRTDAQQTHHDTY